MPGTRLKCLEDPSFEFDAAPATAPTASASATAAASAAPKKPSYRVLEDPFESDKSIGPAVKKSGPYKVLEDPMTTSVYEAAPVASSRPMASEVLEGARERFDKFWSGKAKPEPGAES